MTDGGETGKRPGTMSPEQAVLILKRESRVRSGTVPHAIAGVAVGPRQSWLAGDEFLLRPDECLAFHYARGQGITVARGDGADAIAENLWLNGSVYAAMAAINGFLPFHASAVAWDGRAVAFTGPGGAGKSTLIAALGARGFPMFCDDTLVLDIGGEGAPMAMPGHKRLKLTPAALALTGAARQEEVGAQTGKFYAEPPGGDWQVPLPLGALIFLEEGPDVSLRRISGHERFTRLQDDHYTANIFARARNHTPAEAFATWARLARAIPMLVFTRPRDEARFGEGVDAVAKALRDGLMNEGPAAASGWTSPVLGANGTDRAKE